MRKKLFIAMLSVALILGGFLFTGFNDVNAGSYFTTTGLTVPSSTMQYGKSFSIRGVVRTKSSSVKISKLTVGVTDASGKWISGKYAYVRPNAVSYNLKIVDTKIKFGSLKAGNYKYVIRATNSAGKTELLANKAFTVQNLSWSGVNSPSDYYYGQSFSIKGTISSAVKLKTVTVGITDSSGKHFQEGFYVVKGLNSKSFSIASVDSKIKFGKVPAGSHYYRVIAKDANGRTVNVVRKRFTVSQFKLKNCVSPSSLKAGKSFSIKGAVHSTYTISYVRAGVQKSGKWVSGVNRGVSPSKTNDYNLSDLDPYIKFGKLSAGTYQYRIYVRDTRGMERYIYTKTFKVASSSSDGSSNNNSNIGLKSGGMKLSYSKYWFNKIGRQPYSGPCGGYAMAYGRMVIDGSFNYSGYSSPRNKVIYWYCDGRNLAYWGRAGGASHYTSSSKLANQAVLKQLTKGKPAILAVCTWKSPNHYVTVIGYKPGTTFSNVTVNSFIILDPAYGTERYIYGSEYMDKSKRGMANQYITFNY